MKSIVIFTICLQCGWALNPFFPFRLDNFDQMSVAGHNPLNPLDKIWNVGENEQTDSKEEAERACIPFSSIFCLLTTTARATTAMSTQSTVTTWKTTTNRAPITTGSTTGRPTATTGAPARPTTKPTSPVPSTTTALLILEDTGDLSSSDPFYLAPQGRQESCSDTDVPCTEKCPFVDWLRLFNRTISENPMQTQQFQAGEYPKCFQACINTKTCVAYSFKQNEGICNLYDIVQVRNIVRNPEYTLSFRYNAIANVIREWVVTRDLRPIGTAFAGIIGAKTWLDCLKICDSDPYRRNCSSSVFDYKNGNCTLYKAFTAKDTQLESQLVTIQHASLFSSSNLYRFQYLGQISQVFRQPNYTMSTPNVESCLDICVNDGRCQVATTKTYGASAVDCLIFNYTETIWEEDDSGIANSYFLNIPRNNSRYTTLPHYMVLRAGEEIDNKSDLDLISCHELAQKSENTFWYVYDWTKRNCIQFNEKVLFNYYRNYTEFSSTVYSKSLPTNSISYYAFDYSWVSNIPQTQNPISSGNNGEDCLQNCMVDEDCQYVAVEYPRDRCFRLSAAEANASTITNSDGEPGELRFQLYRKLSDLSFLQNNTQRYECITKESFNWNSSNSVVGPGSLDKYREGIPQGNNGPLEPHGPGFSGGDSETGTRSLQIYDSRSEISHNFIRGKTFHTERLLATGATALFGIGGAALVTGPTPLGVIGVLGAGVVGLGNMIACAFSYCWGEDTETCATACGQTEVGSRSQSTALQRIIYDLKNLDIRARRCTCDTQPDDSPRGATLLGPDRVDRALQDDCRGYPVGRRCEICCRVGYRPRENPLCRCGDRGPDPEWYPEPAICDAVDDCIIGFSNLVWEAGILYLIPVRNCRGDLYYGTVFRETHRLPFYSVYRFSYRNGPGDRRYPKEDWRAYPCTHFNLNQNQLDLGHYTTIGPTLWDKGHFAPHADFRFFRDAVTSTHQYINAAPQEKSSNIRWGHVEARIKTLLSQDLHGSPRSGFVATGTCLTFSPLTVGTVDIEYVPSCFWKMVCTRTNTNEVTVGAFWHLNTLTPTPAEKRARARQIYQIRNQDDLTNLTDVVDIRNVWEESREFFDPGLGYELGLCARAGNIRFPPITPFPPVPPGRAEEDDDYELFNFWHDNIFGDGFDPDEGINSTSVSSNTAGSPPSCGKKAVGYVTGWSDVPFTDAAASYLTHAIFAFIQMKADGSLAVGSADPQHSQDISLDTKKSYLRLYEVKAAKAKSGGRLRTMFAVGGWENSQFFSAVSGDGGATATFIRSALDIIDYFDMDGIDIDWEYPVTGGAHDGIKADRENYVNFLSTIRGALDAHQRDKGRDSRYHLTIAGAAGAWVLEPGFDLKGITDIVDWINVMTYDYFGAWDSQWGAYTGPHAPLYFGAPKRYSGKTNVDYTLKYYSCRIKNPQKLVMGVGFYGRFWNHSGSAVGDDPLWRMATANGAGKFDGGFEPWANIKRKYLEDGSFKKTFHEKTQTPYLLNSDNFLLVYEDEQSIHEKVLYAARKNFAGIMMWAIDLDDNDLTLLRVASSDALCISGSESDAQYKCPPIQEQRWWTKQDGDGSKAGMCGKAAPLYDGYYPVCDPEDPGFACCSKSGYCGSGDDFCDCDGCVNYYDDPNKILEEPIRPTGPVRWHTMDKFVAGPQCGYHGRPLENGELAICNPDNNNGYCCSPAGYCGNGDESCKCDGCVNFRENPNFVYPKKTWIDEGPNSGKCGYNPDLTPSDNIDGNLPTCNSLSEKYHCCSASGYCNDACDCPGCVNFKENPNYVYPPKTWIDSGPDAGKCGKNAQVNGEPATCYPYSDKYYCCSSSGYCGSGEDYCDCDGCINYKK